MHEMADEDHTELTKWLHKSKDERVLSSYRSVLYDELLHGWVLCIAGSKRRRLC